MLDPSAEYEWIVWYAYFACACACLATYAVFHYTMKLFADKQGQRLLSKTWLACRMAAVHYYYKLYAPKGCIGLFFLFLSALGYKGYFSEFTLLSVFFLYHFFVAPDIVMLEKMYKTFYEKKVARATRTTERAKVDRLYE